MKDKKIKEIIRMLDNYVKEKEGDVTIDRELVKELVTIISKSSYGYACSFLESLLHIFMIKGMFSNNAK